MKIVLTNESKGLSLTFFSGDEIRQMYGYEYTIHTANKYVELTNSLIFEYYSPVGFYANATPENFSTQAIAKDGAKWRGNRLKPKTISFMFYPQLARIEGAIASPQTLLNAILEVDEELKVDVFTDRQFTCYFYVEESSNSETGLISLTTSRSGNGIFWRNPNGIDVKSYYYQAGTPYIPKNLPQVLLNPNNGKFPVKFQTFNLVDTEPVITLSHLIMGDWDNLVVKDSNGEQQFTYTNADNDSVIIVNSIEKTVVNDAGEDRSYNFSGDFIILKTGINNISWQVDDNPYLPQDLMLEVQADSYTSTIE